MLYTTSDGIQKEVEEIQIDLVQGLKERTSGRNGKELEIKYKRGDRNSRQLVAQFADNDTPFDLTNYHVRLYALKPDNTKIWDDCEIIDTTHGVVSITLKEQFFSCVGMVKCEFLLTSADDSIMSTPVFKIKIEESINDENAIKSTNDFNALLNAIDKVDELDNLKSKMLSKDSVLSMANMGQDVKEAMTGGSVAVVGKDTVLTDNIVNRQVTKDKLFNFQQVANEFKNVESEKITVIQNAYYHSTDHHLVTGVSGYKVWNFVAHDEDVYVEIDGMFRAHIYSSSDASHSTFIERVGGKDNAGLQRFTLKKGQMLGISLLNTNTPSLRYAPYFQLKGLTIDADNLRGSIDKSRLDFLKKYSVNLFDGTFVDFYLRGAAGSDFDVTTEKGYKTLVIDVEPNTTYTILKEPTTSESGAWYFKVASLTIPKQQILALQSSYAVDGAVRYSLTANDKLKYTFTTGSNDKAIVITVAKSQTPYVEVLKGDYDSFQANSYDATYVFDGIDVYNKHEVDDLINNINPSSIGNSFKKRGSVCDILIKNKVGYRLEHQVSESINLDTWRLTKGTVNNATLWIDTDIEAPIKEVGARDFIGGSHGDERIESAQIVCDGVLVDLNQDVDLTFNNLTVFVKSTLFRCDTQTPVFTRYKKLEFINDELIVSNRLISLVDGFLVERHTGCGLYSVYKDLLIGYSVNTKPELITSGGTSGGLKLDRGTFYGKGFTVTMKALSGKTDHYAGYVVDFASESKPRYKIYFDCITSSKGVLLNTNDELNTSFSIEIK